MPADESNLDASLVQEEDAEEDTDMQNKMRDIMSDAAVTSFEVEDSEKEDLDAGFDFTLDARTYGKAGEDGENLYALYGKEDDEGETGPLVIEWGSKIVIKPLVKGPSRPPRGVSWPRPSCDCGKPQTGSHERAATKSGLLLKTHR